MNELVNSFFPVQPQALTISNDYAPVFRPAPVFNFEAVSTTIIYPDYRFYKKISNWFG